MVDDAYLENKVLGSDPLELVVMLYRGALDGIAGARQALAAGDIRRRADAVSRSISILGELRASLDESRGGELSQNLARLYDYVQGLLLEGNLREKEAAFAEAESLLRTLAEGWEGIQAAATQDPAGAAHPAGGEGGGRNAFSDAVPTETHRWAV